LDKVIALVLIALVMIAFAVYFMLNKEDEKPSKPSPPAKPEPEKPGKPGGCYGECPKHKWDEDDKKAMKDDFHKEERKEEKAERKFDEYPTEGYGHPKKAEAKEAKHEEHDRSRDKK
jgi:hypothetical protein